jgi:hypothetical protein
MEARSHPVPVTGYSKIEHEAHFDDGNVRIMTERVPYATVVGGKGKATTSRLEPPESRFIGHATLPIEAQITDPATRITKIVQRHEPVTFAVRGASAYEAWGNYLASASEQMPDLQKKLLATLNEQKLIVPGQPTVNHRRPRSTT